MGFQLSLNVKTLSCNDATPGNSPRGFLFISGKCSIFAHYQKILDYDTGTT